MANIRRHVTAPGLKYVTLYLSEHNLLKTDPCMLPLPLLADNYSRMAALTTVGLGIHMYMASLPISRGNVKEQALIKNAGEIVLMLPLIACLYGK